MRKISDLDELKAIELIIMKSVHDFCNENEIEYVLAYGTLLGAIRHDGFIPWDDDIDIFMKRPDYEKFKRLFPTAMKKHHLYMATYDTNPKYPRDMIKVCDDRTLLQEKDFQAQDPIGVFIDIWPLDGTPNNNIRRTIKWKIMTLRRIIFEQGTLTETAIKSRANGISRLVRLLLHKYVNIYGIEKYLAKSIQMAMHDDGGNSQILECFSAPTRLSHFEASEFKKRILHKFETEVFYIPAEWDSILRKRYGDYMKLPPEDEQVPRHISDVYWRG